MRVLDLPEPVAVDTSPAACPVTYSFPVFPSPHFPKQMSLFVVPISSPSICCNLFPIVQHNPCRGCLSFSFFNFFFLCLYLAFAPPTFRFFPVLVVMTFLFVAGPTPRRNAACLILPTDSASTTKSCLRWETRS